MEHEHAEHAASDMLTIARCRELLGDKAEGLPDDEIDRVRHHADAMARVIVEIFLEQQTGQEQPK